MIANEKLSTLSQGLIAHWKLDEEDGERADSLGVNSLTDNNTVTKAEGVLDNAGQFTLANSEYLSILDNEDLSCGAIDYTWAAWVYMDSNPVGVSYILSKADNFTADYKLFREITAGKPFVFQVGGAIATSGTTTTTGTWYFVVCWLDTEGDTVNIQINDGTIDSTTELSIATNTVDFIIGATKGAMVVESFHDGRIDSVSLWKRLLTADERTALYNDGNGLDYPF